MRFLVFALIMALMVSMLTADHSGEKHHRYGKRGHRHRDRRYVPTETVDSDSDLPPYDVRIQPYPYPEPSGY